MAIQLPPNFKEDLNTQNTNLVPVVTISSGYNSASIIISTGTLDLEVVFSSSGQTYNKQTLPLLLNLPSLKESIDPIDRKYKISSLNLDVNNFKYHDGLRFVDRQDNFINESIRIYWVSPSANVITFYDTYLNTDYEDATINSFDNRALQIFYGKIKKFDYDDSKVRMVVEDFTQSALHKQIPVNNVGDGDLVPDKYKNKPYPIVYGSVKNAPTVKLKSDETIADGHGVGSLKVYADYDESTYIYNIDSAVKIYSANDYVTVAKTTPQELNLGSYEGELINSSFGYKEGEEVYTHHNNMIHLLAKNEDSTPDAEFTIDGDDDTSADDLVGKYGNPVTHNRIIVAHHASSIQDMDIAPIAEQSNYWSSLEVVGNAFLCSISNTNTNPATIFGTFGVNRKQSANGEATGYHDWMLTSVLAGLDVNGDTGEQEDCDHVDAVVVNARNWALVGCNITTNAPKLKDIVKDEDGKEQVYYALKFDLSTHYGNVENLDGASDNHVVNKIRIGSQTKGDLYHSGHDLYLDQYPSNNQWYEARDYTNAQFNYPDGIFLKNGDGLLIYMRPTHNNENAGVYKHGVKMQFSTLDLFQYSLIDDVVNQDFFVRCKGRGGDNARVPDIINDILTNELKYTGTINLPTLDEQASLGYGDWKYDFSINKLVNSKSIMEDLSAVSPYIPRFNNLGQFQFTTIPKNGGEITTEDHIIKVDQCLDYSFKRTDFDKIYTKIVINYDFSYSSEDFKKKYEVSIGDLKQQSNLQVTDYDGSKYGITDYDEEFEMNDGSISNTTYTVNESISKFIINQNTAKFYATWLLTWHCNPHLVIKIKLPIKWFFIEVGEICKFDKLIGGIKPYNIDYYNGDTLNSNLSAFNTFLVINSNKTLDYIELELIQLHQLYTLDPTTDEVTVIGCMDETACNYDENANLNSGCLQDDCCGNCGETAVLNACGECCNNGVNCNGDPCAACGEGCDNQGGVEDECGNCGGNCNPSSTGCFIEGVEYCDCDLTPATTCCDGNTTCGECEACGCMDTLAVNYDPDAVIDDNSCIYPEAITACPNIDLPNAATPHTICNIPAYAELYCNEIGGYLLHNENQIGMYSVSDIINQNQNNNLWVVNPSHVPYQGEENPTDESKLLTDNFLGTMRAIYSQQNKLPYYIGHQTTCYIDAPIIDNFIINADGIPITIDPSVEGVTDNDFVAPEQKIVIQSLLGQVLVLGNEVYYDPYIIKGMILKLVHNPEATVIDNIKMNLTIQNVNHQLNFDDNEEVGYNLTTLNIGNDGYEIVRAITPNTLSQGNFSATGCAWQTESSTCEWELEFDEDDINTTLSNQGETSLNIPENLYSLFLIKNNFPFDQLYDIDFETKLTVTINDNYQYNITIPYRVIGCVDKADANGDAAWDVLDIVEMANCVLNQNCTDLEYVCAMDINGDTYYNVLDIINLANCILAQDCDQL